MKAIIVAQFVLCSLLGITQENSSDSAITYSNHIRADIGVSMFQGITRYFYPWYDQSFYISVSRMSEKWNFVPGASFTCNQSIFQRDSLIYERRLGNLNMLLSIKLVKNNFPKNLKHNFYYGISLGGFYSYLGREQYALFNVSKTHGIVISPVLGFDQKIRGWLRFFGEIQIGAILKQTTNKQYLYEDLYSDSGKISSINFFAYNPFILGVSILFNR